MIPNVGGEVRGLLRTRDGQTTGCRDGERLHRLDPMTAERYKHRKKTVHFNYYETENIEDAL